jgi:uncharacterized cysteine cluster protein YcgN (CxxCxxCC family)
MTEKTCDACGHSCEKLYTSNQKAMRGERIVQIFDLELCRNCRIDFNRLFSADRRIELSEEVSVHLAQLMHRVGP